MDIKYTRKTLNQLEQIVEEAEYLLRYEKGHFHSGFCILENRKIVVVNKFLETEGKINALLDIIPSLTIDIEKISPEIMKMYDLAMAQDPA